VSNKISVIFPSRGRSKICIEAVDSLYDFCDDPNRIEVLIGVDDDDNISLETLSKYAKDNSSRDITIVEFKRKSYENFIEYINELALKSTGDWIFGFSDDMLVKTQGWDSEVIKYSDFTVISPAVPNNYSVRKSIESKKKKPKTVYSYNPIWPRAWLDTLGYISKDVAADVWTHEVAEKVGIFHMANEIELYSRRYKDSGEEALDDETFKYMQQSRRAFGRENPYVGRSKKSKKEAIELLKAYKSKHGK
jgi:hypothetical protein